MLNACSSGLSMATRNVSVATLSTFIGIPVSIPLSVVFWLQQALWRGYGTHQKVSKEAGKVTKLTYIITSAIAIFEKSVSKALNNGEIDEQEFRVTPQGN